MSISDIYALSFSDNTLILISESTPPLIKMAEKQWILTNNHNYKYSTANQWIIHWFLFRELCYVVLYLYKFKSKQVHSKVYENKNWKFRFIFDIETGKLAYIEDTHICKLPRYVSPMFMYAHALADRNDS